PESARESVRGAEEVPKRSEADTPGAATVAVTIDGVALAPLVLTIPGWQPIRVETPRLAGQRRRVEVRVEADARARVAFRLWTLKER
ncbi:MAG: hypothetical protein AABZ30_05335, partial [Myxococcota bacterium]